MCLLEGCSVREVDNLLVFLKTAGGTPPYIQVSGNASLCVLQCCFLTANDFKTHQFHRIGDVTLET